MSGTERLAFIGCGNMGYSLIGGLIRNGYPANLIQASDPQASQRAHVSEQFGITTHADNRPLVDFADTIVLATKPQVVRQVLLPLRPSLTTQDKLLVSVVAGVPLGYFEQCLHKEMPVIRVMPNIAVLVQAGAAGMIANAFVQVSGREIAEEIMRSVGLAIWLEEEDDIDSVTALSGSGPAYFFLLMEILEQAGLSMGLGLEQARQLTLFTALGAAKMAITSEMDPAALRRQVSSPGGTTEQAMNVLLSGDINGLFKQAVEAARQRAKTLAHSLKSD